MSSTVNVHGITLDILNSRPCLHTVSYAAVRSMNTAYVFILFWKPVSMWVVNASTCSVQLQFLRKPTCSTGKTFSISGWIRLSINLSKSLYVMLSSDIGRQFDTSSPCFPGFRIAITFAFLAALKYVTS